MPTKAPTDKGSARELATRLVRDAISIAITRNDMTWNNEECTEDEIITDALDVILGDNTGCLDPDNSRRRIALESLLSKLWPASKQKRESVR